MRTFVIYHPLNSDFNFRCKRGVFEYEEVAVVQKNSLNEVYQWSQNDFNTTYKCLEKRSTSVGDIIVDRELDKHYFVAGCGFQEIPQTVVQFIDWSNHIPKASS